MELAHPHTSTLSPADAGFARMLGGVREIIGAVEEQYLRCAEEKNTYRQQLAAAQIEPVNIVADKKQKELIAIVNAIFEAGYVTDCTKGEYMQRMATAFGAPSIANYSAPLYNVMNASKYEDIFNNLKDVAIEAKSKMQEKE